MKIISEDYQFTCNETLRRVLCDHFYSVRGISITYSMCVSVALGIQHAKHMPSSTLSLRASLALPYFPDYLLNVTILGGGKTY